MKCISQQILMMMICYLKKPLKTYELESLNEEIERFFIEERCFTGVNYPFLFETNFSTLGSFIEKPSGRKITN